MKKYLSKWILLLVCSCCSITSYAQYGGEWVLGGRFNYTGGGRVMMPDGSKVKRGFTISAAPSLAYFIRNGLAVGMSVGYEYLSDREGHQNTAELMPFIRYDFGGGRLRFFLQGASGIALGKSVMKNENDGRHFIWNSTLKPGLWIRITDQIATEATFSSLSYKRIRMTDLKTDEVFTDEKWKFRWLDISFGVAFIF